MSIKHADQMSPQRAVRRTDPEGTPAGAPLRREWTPRPAPGLLAGEMVRVPASPAHLRRSSQPNDPLGGTQIRDDVAARLAARRGQGEKLPNGLATSMGAALGAGLGAVRIHRDGEAATIARSMQATAFTEGTDIYFGAGQYSAGTTSGQRLLAHELAHVVQHSRGEHAGPRGTIGHASDPAETAADQVADGVMTTLRRQHACGPRPADLAREATHANVARRTASVQILRQLAAESLVLRGGTCLEAQFTNGSGVVTAKDGKLSKVSVNSADGQSALQLSNKIPQGQVGQTTVGAIRDASGTITEDPTKGNPSHCLAGGLTGAQFNALFTPTVPNPTKAAEKAAKRVAVK